MAATEIRKLKIINQNGKVGRSGLADPEVAARGHIQEDLVLGVRADVVKPAPVFLVVVVLGADRAVQGVDFLRPSPGLKSLAPGLSRPAATTASAPFLLNQDLEKVMFWSGQSILKAVYVLDFLTILTATVQ